MTNVAIIGGSGLTNLKNLKITRREVMRTPFGEPSAAMVFGDLGGQEVVFLPRHGPSHTIPPHEINYRANIWSLKEIGVAKVIAVAAVGGISDPLAPCDLVLPDQIIDYTYGRAHTFFSVEHKKVTHVDFTYPYCEELRAVLHQASKSSGVTLKDGGTYGATQGPRFESAAEILRLERDGADIVGMTGMPEASLAREMGLCYATIAVVANRAAGKIKGVLSLKEIEKNLELGMTKVRSLLEYAIPMIVRI